MWNTFFRDGGWGMYPTSLFGFLLVAAATLTLLRPERRFVPVLLALAAVTLGSGLLAFSVGVANSLHFLPRAPPADRFTLAALGVAESLNNVVLALVLVVLASLLAALAALRAALAPPPTAA